MPHPPPMRGLEIQRQKPTTETCHPLESFKNNWYFLLGSQGRFRLCRFVTKLRLCSSPATPKFLPDTLSIKIPLISLQLLRSRTKITFTSSRFSRMPLCLPVRYIPSGMRLCRQCPKSFRDISRDLSSLFLDSS